MSLLKSCRPLAASFHCTWPEQARAPFLPGCRRVRALCTFGAATREQRQCNRAGCRQDCPGREKPGEGLCPVSVPLARPRPGAAPRPVVSQAVPSEVSKGGHVISMNSPGGLAAAVASPGAGAAPAFPSQEGKVRGSTPGARLLSLSASEAAAHRHSPAGSVRGRRVQPQPSPAPAPALALGAAMSHGVLAPGSVLQRSSSSEGTAQVSRAGASILPPPESSPRAPRQGSLRGAASQKRGEGCKSRGGSPDPRPGGGNALKSNPVGVPKQSPPARPAIFGEKTVSAFE